MVENEFNLYAGGSMGWDSALKLSPPARDGRKVDGTSSLDRLL